MALAQPYSGTATVGATEFSLPNGSTTLTPITVDGIYQAFIDFNAMATGDSYEVVIREMARTGDTQRVVFRETLVGAQTSPLYVTASLLLLHGWDITVRKVGGTDRTILWSIRQVA